jgi:hypothetical protein
VGGVLVAHEALTTPTAPSRPAQASG